MKKLLFLFIVAAAIFLGGCRAQLVPVYDSQGNQVGYTEQRRKVSLSIYGGYQPTRYYNQYQYQYQQQRPVYYQQAPVYQQPYYYYPQQQPYYTPYR